MPSAASADTKYAEEEAIPVADEDVAAEESMAAESAEIGAKPKIVLASTYRRR